MASPLQNLLAFSLSLDYIASVHLFWQLLWSEFGWFICLQLHFLLLALCYFTAPNSLVSFLGPIVYYLWCLFFFFFSSGFTILSFVSASFNIHALYLTRFVLLAQFWLVNFGTLSNEVYAIFWPIHGKLAYFMVAYENWSLFMFFVMVEPGCFPSVTKFGSLGFLISFWQMTGHLISLS